MSMQQSFNAGLTGATFLLGQLRSGFKSTQESSLQDSQLGMKANEKVRTHYVEDPTVQAKQVQADARIKDRFKIIEMNRKRALDSIHSLRSELSNRQAKRLIYKTNQMYDKQIDNERRQQNGSDE